MRIGIQTWGSDGDIRPFIALAGGLQAAGHGDSVSRLCAHGFCGAAGPSEPWPMAQSTRMETRPGRPRYRVKERHSTLLDG